MSRVRTPPPLPSSADASAHQPHSFLDIVCNGDPVTLDVERLADVLDRLGYADRRVAVAVNESFVAKEEWPSYRVRAGDRLDVLSAIEGG